MIGQEAASKHADLGPYSICMSKHERMNFLGKTLKNMSDWLMTQRLSYLFEEGSDILHAYRYSRCWFPSR